MSAPDNPDLKPNGVTMTYHGLKSALNLIGLLEQLVEKRSIKLVDPEILLDDGTLIKFKDREYIQFSKTALANTLTTMTEVFAGKSSSVKAVSFVKKLSESETRLQNIVESGDKDKPTGRRG
jgi:hypothetical protein